MLVNNRAEGNAPLTVQALVDMLRNSVGTIPGHSVSCVQWQAVIFESQLRRATATRSLRLPLLPSTLHPEFAAANSRHNDLVLRMSDEGLPSGSIDPLPGIFGST